MSVLCARATATRTAFDRSAPQPAEARSLLTRANTCASALVSPVVAGGAGLGVGLGAGLVTGLVVVRGAGRGVVRVGAGGTRTVRCVVRRGLAPEPAGRVLEGRL